MNNEYIDDKVDITGNEFCDRLSNFDFVNVDEEAFELINSAIRHIEALVVLSRGVVGDFVDSTASYRDLLDSINLERAENEETKQKYRKFLRKELDKSNKYIQEQKSVSKKFISDSAQKLIETFDKTISDSNQKMGETLDKLTEDLKKAKADLLNSRKGVIKGGTFSPWKPHENIILQVISEFLSDENQLKRPKDPSRFTILKAIDKISKETGQKLQESTFTTWLKRYRENSGKVFS